VSVGASDQEMKPEIKKAKSLTVAKTTILYGKISELFFANENSPLLQNGCWKFASSLQHYNCIFQSCQRFANAHSYGFVLDMIFKYNY